MRDNEVNYTTSITFLKDCSVGKKYQSHLETEKFTGVFLKQKKNTILSWGNSKSKGGRNLQDKVLERVQEICARLPLSLAYYQAAHMQDKTPWVLAKNTYHKI